ncbi:MAG: hypothetical protein ACJ8EY_09795 [Sphingomicrobium sp.]
MRLALFVTGILLMALSPIAGAIPGPGGIFVFAGGLALALKNSDWAKRQYVKFKRRQPKAGHWMDWGLRRRSARRRYALHQQQQRSTSSHGAGKAVKQGKFASWLQRNAPSLFRFVERRRAHRTSYERGLMAKLTGRDEAAN